MRHLLRWRSGLAHVGVLAVRLAVERGLEWSHITAEGVGARNELVREVEHRRQDGLDAARFIGQIHRPAKGVERPSHGRSHVDTTLDNSNPAGLVLLVANHVRNLVAEHMEDVQPVLHRDGQIAALGAHLLRALHLGARRQHDDDVALLDVGWDLVPIGHAVIWIITTSSRAGQGQAHGGSGDASHVAHDLGVAEHLKGFLGALDAGVVEQVQSIQDLAILALAVEVGGQILGDARSLGWRLAHLARRAIGRYTGRILRDGPCVLQHPQSGLGGPRGLVEAHLLGEVLGLRAGLNHHVTDVAADFLQALGVEAARRAACGLVLQKPLVPLAAGVQLLAFISGRNRHGACVVRYKFCSTFLTKRIQRRCSAKAEVAHCIHHRELWVVARQRVAQQTGVQAHRAHQVVGHLTGFIGVGLAHGAQQQVILDLDVDLAALDLDRDGVLTLLDDGVARDAAGLAVQRLARGGGVNLPQCIVRVGQHEVQEHLSHMVALATHHGALVVVNDVLHQLPSARAAALGLQRLRPADVEALARAAAGGLAVLVHQLKAAQRDVVVVGAFQLVELILRDEPIGQHRQAVAAGNGHQVGVQLLKLGLVARQLHQVENAVCLIVGHARSAVLHLGVDAGDVGVALLGVHRVGVQRQLIQLDAELHRLLHQRLNLLVSKV